ncbi:MAG: protein-glutamate O-methyltransferase CheR [Proteobacteria bacterium]|nr:protein-glutamate O-methyltransferase CheR [Pseudomonadota bacterium]
MTSFERPTLTPTQFNLFAELIYEISGIKFQESKNYFLASKLDLRRKALELNNIDEYYRLLKTKLQSDPEYNKLLNEVTINETFFYRNIPQLESYNKEVLTEILDKKRKTGDKRIRIWSAACSTGDEAFTLIMDMLEKNLHKEFTIEVVGTDISEKAVQAAKDGMYKRYDIRNIPPHLLQRHFTVQDEYNYKISDDLKKYANFKYCNLSSSSGTGALGKFDIVFCRNVLIYFDRHSRENVLQNIYNNLATDGFLLVGHSENLYAERHLFENCKDKLQALAYTKAPQGTPKAKF